MTKKAFLVKYTTAVLDLLTTGQIPNPSQFDVDDLAKFICEQSSEIATEIMNQTKQNSWCSDFSKQLYTQLEMEMEMY